MTTLKVGLIHVCQRSELLFSGFVKSNVSVEFQSIPFFDLPADAHLRHKTNASFPLCIEIVSYFLEKLRQKDEKILKLDQKCLNIINQIIQQNPNLLHLYDRSIHSDLLISDRVALTYKLSELYFEFLFNHPIDVLIFGIVPHHPWDFLFFKVAVKLGIKVYFSVCYPFTGNFCFIYDSDMQIVHPPDSIRSKYFDLINELQIEVSKNLLLKGSSIPKKLSPYDEIMSDIYRGNKGTNIKPTAFTQIVKDAYKVSGDNIQLNSFSKIVIFALHYEPELAANPLGKDYWEQRLAINDLRHSLPTNTLLILKEHPYWKNVEPEEEAKYRGPSFFSGISSCSGPIVYVDYNLPLSAYFPFVDAIATLSGSVPLEAISLGIPSIVMGASPYHGLPGVINCVDQNITQLIDQAKQELLLQVHPSILDNLYTKIWPFAPYGLSSEIIELPEESKIQNEIMSVECMCSLIKSNVK